jgi:hypothetical protein
VLDDHQGYVAVKVMSKVQLKVNMIFEGIHYARGHVLEQDDIPLNLRKNKYLEEPGDSVVETIDEDYEEDSGGEEGLEEEGPIEPPPITRPKRLKKRT